MIPGIDHVFSRVRYGVVLITCYHSYTGGFAFLVMIALGRNQLTKAVSRITNKLQSSSLKALPIGDWTCDFGWT